MDPTAVACVACSDLAASAPPALAHKALPAQTHAMTGRGALARRQGWQGRHKTPLAQAVWEQHELAGAFAHFVHA